MITRIIQPIGDCQAKGERKDFSSVFQHSPDGILLQILKLKGCLAQAAVNVAVPGGLVDGKMEVFSVNGKTAVGGAGGG